MDQKDRFALTNETLNCEGITLHRVQYLVDIRDKNGIIVAAANSYGGFVSSLDCLEDDSVVLGEAKIINSTLKGSVLVKDYATISNSTIEEDARVEDLAIITNSKVKGKVLIHGGAHITNCDLGGNFNISGLTRITNLAGEGDIHICGSTVLNFKKGIHIVAYGGGKIDDSTLYPQKPHSELD